MKVSVPWPPAALRPNKSSPGNWWEKSRSAKTYRTGCAWEAKAAGLRKIEAETLPVTITFHPPDRRRRDRDNMIAATKHACDGIADILGVDDHKWVPTYVLGEPVERGRVVFEFDPPGNWKSIGQLAQKLVKQANDGRLDSDQSRNS